VAFKYCCGTWALKSKKLAIDLNCCIVKYVIDRTMMCLND